MRGRVVYLSFFVLHGFFILATASRDALWLVARGYTASPKVVEEFSGAGEALIHSALGGNLSSRHPAAQLIRGYLHGAGIDAGYSYFAPNVSGGYKLAFEFHLADGRVEYDAFQPETREGELRLGGLLDEIVQSPSAAIREALLKLLAQAAVAQRYPDAVRVKAVVAALQLPSAAEFKAGKRRSYDFLYAYDFDFNERPARENF